MATPRGMMMVNVGVAAVATLTFPAADLVFAAAPASCYHHERFKNFHVTLHEWLVVDAVVQLAFVVPFAYVLIACATNQKLMLLLSIIRALQHLFIFVWTIVGGVLFWHFLMPRDCSADVQMYMWTRLIVGLVSTVHYH